MNMKVFYKNILSVISGLSLLSLFSCTEEAPLYEEGGTAPVKFSFSLNDKVTRAVSSEESASLKQSLVMQISDGKGMLYNWKGAENIPVDPIVLRYGDFIARAYAGDSLPASFDKRYFKGETAFSIKNQVSTKVSVVCNIANVEVGVNVDEIEKKYQDKLQISFSTTNGKLDFSKDNFNKKGYFMRKFVKSAGDYDDVISYTVNGLDKDGNPFTKSGKINGVLPGHGYTLKIESSIKDETSGGLTINIQIEDYVIENSHEVTLQGRPEFYWEKSPIIINGQVIFTEENAEDITLIAVAYKDFKSLFIELDDETDNDLFNAFGDNLPIDLTIATSVVQNRLEQLGITWEKENESDFIKYSIRFSADWLKKLPVKKNDEYSLKLTAEDNRNFRNTTSIGFANDASAIAAPFEIDDSYWENNYLSVRAHYASVNVKMLEGASAVENPKLQYRKKGEEEWNDVALNNVRDGRSRLITLSNLESDFYPNSGVTYECRIVAGEIGEDGEYQIRTKEIKSFTTETKFIIPNAGMEEWSDSGKVKEPFGSSYNDENGFWDTGNHGVMGNALAGIINAENLTMPDYNNFHGGKASAALKSKFMVIKLGAGNIFSGKFYGTVNTTEGIIDLGRKFNSSHPSALKVWVKYLPKQTTSNSNKGAKKKIIPDGELDQGQIYIALSTDIHRANTNEENTLVSQDNLPKTFIAFNEHTFEGNFEQNGGFKEVIIPFKYLSNAETNEPNYIIIVCSASKYGDYFNGGDGSMMYVDDFELIYSEQPD